MDAMAANTYANPGAKRTREVETPKGAAIFMIGAVVLLWVLEIIDWVLVKVLHWFSLDSFGIRPHELEGLPGILFSPFLHDGFPHLASNSPPLLVLGFLILIGQGGARRFLVATVISALTSGIVAWLLSAHGLVVGASGVIFGWLTYLIARGALARDWKSIAISIFVLIVYGSVIWGVFPSTEGVSWQAHLGGAIGGVLAAWLMHKRRGRATAGSYA